MGKTSEIPSNDTKSDDCNDIDIEIDELILTPFSCAAVVKELIQTLIYQKGQIPYPYPFLKGKVDHRKAANDQSFNSYTLEKHFYNISTMVTCVESLVENLFLQFKEYGRSISQVLILFGTNVYRPKELFHIKINGVTSNPFGINNYSQANLVSLHKLMRKILFSERWYLTMKTELPLTNMYILLQRHIRKDEPISNQNFFVANREFLLPSNIHNVSINLNYNKTEQWTIFQDDTSSTCNQDNSSKASEKSVCDDSKNLMCTVDVNTNLVWFQADFILRGFKECLINKEAATQLL